MMGSQSMREEYSNISPALETRDIAVVADIPIDRLTAAQWVDLLISDWKAKAGPKVVTTANGQVVSLFATHADYRHAVLTADHIAADGMSVVKGSRTYTSTPIPERVSTTDWFHDAARAAIEHGLKFYMLGAEQEANTRAVERALKLHPGLQIVGRRHGYFKDEEIPQIAEAVRASGADILWIGVGNPRQVIVGHKFKALLPELTWIRTCGGLFDFLSGDRPRAPGWLQSLGFEWAWRALLEPQRLLWRYVTTSAHTMVLMATRSRKLPERKGHGAANPDLASSPS
jgi:exopolysaccharide biosynthesis WecB/TagA/CpsF family protein